MSRLQLDQYNQISTTLRFLTQKLYQG